MLGANGRNKAVMKERFRKRRKNTQYMLIIEVFHVEREEFK